MEGGGGEAVVVTVDGFCLFLIVVWGEGGFTVSQTSHYKNVFENGQQSLVARSKDQTLKHSTLQAVLLYSHNGFVSELCVIKKC